MRVNNILDEEFHTEDSVAAEGVGDEAGDAACLGNGLVGHRLGLPRLIPSHKVAEDDEFFAFLDINPVALGHTLVIPKKEVDYIFDIDDPMLGRMVAFAKRVARAQETAIECKRVGLAVMGLEVPHAHIHLIPITKESDMYFGGKKLAVSQEELAEIAAKIRKEFK